MLGKIRQQEENFTQFRETRCSIRKIAREKRPGRRDYQEDKIRK